MLDRYLRPNPTGSPTDSIRSEGVICASHPASTPWVVLGLTVVVALTLWVRLANPTGWLGSDDVGYHSAAEQVLAGDQIRRIHHHYARMAVILPVAASMHLLGESPTTVALPMLIASILCVLVVAAIGKLVWGWWEGLCAATIVAVLPYFRVLSTAGYPDVHVCLWAATATLLALLAARSTSRRRCVLLLLACGFAFGLAMSAKVYAAPVAAGIAVILWTTGRRTIRSRLAHASLVAAGAALFAIVEGSFYHWAAGDFFYTFHAHRQAQSGIEEIMHPAGAPSAVGFAAFAWHRIAMMFDPARSGWGWLGCFFSPAIIVTLIASRRGRFLGVWAAAMFLTLAVMPIRLADGVQFTPVFHGRHILPACIPFALCLAWLMRCGVQATVGPQRLGRAWPVAFAAIVAISLGGRHQLNGFVDRDTSRVGKAMSQVIAAANWDENRPIFMTPSTYWRYRILFPQELRARLRVAAASDAPSWWRDVSIDIAQRHAVLPDRSQAYLIATPRQLRGETEYWDYGVGLPQKRLASWQEIPPIIGISRYSDKTIGPSGQGDGEGEPLLVLVGGNANAPTTLAGAPGQ